MWKRTPALFIGLYLYAGMSFAVQGSYLAFLPLIFAKRRLPLALLLMSCAFFYVPKEAVGPFRVTEIRRSKARFSKGFVVRGKQGRMPVTVYTKEVPEDAGFAHFRYRMKEDVRLYLEGQFEDPRCGAFLAGLVTGDFSEPSLLFDFGKLGLQHLMAISGFHFSLIALILSVLLRPLLPYKWAASCLVVLLSGYFLLLGNSPSIQRAFVMALVVLFSWIFEKRSTGINSMGVALIAVLLWDPFAVRSLGFQFSFLCTAGILFFYAPIEKRLFSNYTLRDASQMTLFQQHGFLVLTIVRKSFALGLAVHLVALPLTLFYFHKFPMLSFAYNLVFPFLVSLALLFLPFALVMPFLFRVEEGLISFVLNLAQRIPASLEFTLRVQGFPLTLLVIYLVFLLYVRYEPTRHPLLQPRRALFFGHSSA